MTDRLIAVLALVSAAAFGAGIALLMFALLWSDASPTHQTPVVCSAVTPDAEIVYFRCSGEPS